MNQSWLVVFFFIVCGVAGNSVAGVTAYSAVKADYSFSEFGFVQDSNPVVQSGVTVSKGNCFVDFWMSFATDFGNEGNEVDYTFGCGTTVGNIEVNASIAYFDLPTPSATDFDFDSDVVRLKTEASRTFVLREGDSLKVWAGVDRITGLIETWSFRTGATWTHSFNDQWSSRAGIGASHQTFDGYTGLWGTIGVDHKLAEDVSVGATLDWYAGDTGGHVTPGLRISKSW